MIVVNWIIKPIDSRSMLRCKRHVNFRFGWHEGEGGNGSSVDMKFEVKGVHKPTVAASSVVKKALW